MQIKETTDDDKLTVIGKPAKAREDKIPGHDDPDWLKEFREAYPQNLTLHALIRAQYQLLRKDKPEREARARAIINASSKVLAVEQREIVLSSIAPKGSLSHILDMESLIESSASDLEQTILEYVDESDE